MKEVAVYEAKTRLSELLADVERGDTVTITRRGVPVARLVSARGIGSRGRGAIAEAARGFSHAGAGEDSRHRIAGYSAA